MRRLRSQRSYNYDIPFAISLGAEKDIPTGLATEQGYPRALARAIRPRCDWDGEVELVLTCSVAPASGDSRNEPREEAHLEDVWKVSTTNGKALPPWLEEHILEYVQGDEGVLASLFEACCDREEGYVDAAEEARYENRRDQVEIIYREKGGEY